MEANGRENKWSRWRAFSPPGEETPAEVASSSFMHATEI